MQDNKNVSTSVFNTLLWMGVRSMWIEETFPASQTANMSQLNIQGRANNQMPGQDLKVFLSRDQVMNAFSLNSVLLKTER